MVQVQSLGPAPSRGNKIVGVNVVFPSGKTEMMELTEQQSSALKTQNPDGYVTFTSAEGETVKMYFDYYKYPDGIFAFILSEQPIPINWWSTV